MDQDRNTPPWYQQASTATGNNNNSSTLQTRPSYPPPSAARHSATLASDTGSFGGLPNAAFQRTLSSSGPLPSRPLGGAASGLAGAGSGLATAANTAMAGPTSGGVEGTQEAADRRMLRGFRLSPALQLPDATTTTELQAQQVPRSAPAGGLPPSGLLSRSNSQPGHPGLGLPPTGSGTLVPTPQSAPVGLFRSTQQQQPQQQQQGAQGLASGLNLNSTWASGSYLRASMPARLQTTPPTSTDDGSSVQAPQFLSPRAMWNQPRRWVCGVGVGGDWLQHGYGVGMGAGVHKGAVLK